MVCILIGRVFVDGEAVSELVAGAGLDVSAVSAGLAAGEPSGLFPDGCHWAGRSLAHPGSL